MMDIKSTTSCWKKIRKKLQYSESRLESIKKDDYIIPIKSCLRRGNIFFDLNGKSIWICLIES